MPLRAAANRTRRKVYGIAAATLAVGALYMVYKHSLDGRVLRGLFYIITGWFSLQAIWNYREGVDYTPLFTTKEGLYATGFILLGFSSVLGLTGDTHPGLLWVAILWIGSFLVADMITFEFILRRGTDLARAPVMTTRGPEEGLIRRMANYWAQRVAGEIRHGNVSRPEVAQLVEALVLVGVINESVIADGDRLDWVHVEAQRMREQREEQERLLELRRQAGEEANYG